MATFAKNMSKNGNILLVFQHHHCYLAHKEGLIAAPKP